MLQSIGQIMPSAAPVRPEASFNHHPASRQSASRSGEDTVVLRFGGRRASAMVINKPPAFDPGNPASMDAYKTLIEKAQTFAQPHVSNYHVGAVGIGQSGRAYLGCNLEFKGTQAANTVHGEMFVTALAKAQGEEKLTDIFLSGPPCGGCRQVLSEGGNPDLRVHFLNYDGSGPFNTATLGSLYPSPFISTGIGEDKNVFKAPALNLPQPKGALSPLAKKAFQAAQSSYLPKPDRKTWAGIAVELANGKQYSGRALTMSGANTTITPMQDVLVRIIADGQNPADIRQAVFIEPDEPDYSFREQARQILGSLAPGAALTGIQLPG